MPRNCLVINLDRCTGCDSCIVSCKFENSLPLGIFYNRVIQVGPTGQYPNIERYNLPVQCQQCTHARCVEVCPTGASYRDEKTGIVLIDASKCIGCQYCLYACPYGVRSWNESEKVVEKCTLCQQLDEPYCVTNCAVHARFYGDLDDPNSDVSRLLAEKGGSVHRLTDAGNGPASFYVLSDKYASWIPNTELDGTVGVYAAGSLQRKEG